MTLFLFFLVTLAASVIHTASSFGFGIFVIATYPFLMSDYGGVTVVADFLAMVLTGINAWRWRKDIVWDWIKPTLISYFVVSVVAVGLMSGTSDGLLKKLLGIVLVSLGVYFIFFQGNFKIAPSGRNGFIAGGLSGALGSLFCVGGPPIVLYLLAVSDDIRKYSATMQTWFALTGALVLALRVANGMVTTEAIRYSLWGLLCLPPGIYLGNKILNRINADSLKKIVYTVMLINGVFFIFN